MMQRSGRRTTLIDPATLQPRPASGIGLDQPQPRPGQGKRTSSAPLLDFGGDERLLSEAGKTKSVFGVDQLWQRELDKLQQIEEVERKAAEDEQRKAEAMASRKRRGKGKADLSPEPNIQATVARSASPPPLLPNVPATGGKPVPNAHAVSSDSESEQEVKLTRARRSSIGTLHTLGAKGWFASSDEEEGGVSAPQRQGRPSPAQKQRLASTAAPQPSPRRAAAPQGSDSDDVPLAAQLSRLPRPANVSDSDEDRPLAALVDKSRPSMSNLPSLSLGGSLLPETKPLASGPNADDEDDVPLGLRHAFSRPSIPRNNGSDDDNKPLGLQRMSQYPAMPSMPMMAPQVPIFTPQQMLMQAQMQHASMYSAAPSLMGGYVPFMGAPMMPAQMMAPMPQDSGTFGRVDRWRRDIADQGDTA